MRYFKKIVGDRVYLSPLNKDDAEIYTKWLNDYEVARGLGYYRQLVSLEAEKRILDSLTTEGHNYAIVLKENDTLIGSIGFLDIKQYNRSAAVGLFIGEGENRGKGYGAEALRLILDYGFRTLNFHNVMLYVHSDNEIAIACYKKVGFKEIGRRRECKFKDGKLIDVVSMDILSTEFLMEVNMDVMQAISSRYSHKEEFLPDAVPLDVLNKIARAGLDAPSGNNRQTVRLIILPDQKALGPVCDVSPTAGLRTAPAAIAVLTDSKQVPEGAMNFEKEDYSAAVENMLLAATGLGYVSLWLDSPYFDSEKEKMAREVLGAPEHFRLWAVLPIGKPDGEGSRREKLAFSERVSYGRFGGV